MCVPGRTLNCWQLRPQPEFSQHRVTCTYVFTQVPIIFFSFFKIANGYINVKTSHLNFHRKHLFPLFGLCTQKSSCSGKAGKGHDKLRNWVNTRKEGRSNLCNFVSLLSHLSCFITSSWVLYSPLGPERSALKLLASSVIARFCVSPEQSKGRLCSKPKEPARLSVARPVGMTPLG